MTVFYVDPINGNDASAGTSFATRWCTFTTGATAARIAPGDEIRCIASDDPTDMGQTATWTKGSKTVTLTSAVTSNIFLSSGWTAASTNASITTSTDRKVGITSASCTIAAAFTTGKAAYFTIGGGGTDYSAYQQVSFWIKITNGTMIADGNLSLTLCSDTTGTTVVNTINIPYIKANNIWVPITVNTGAALGSSIQSVALVVNADRGAMTVLVNNILACKASSAVDSLTLSSLISKNTGYEPWLGIQSITGTTVSLEFNPQYNLSQTAGRGYAGSTQTTQIYKREPIILPTALVGVSQAANASLFGQLLDSGSSSSQINYSGGWNTTDMSAQTGDTYISGVQSTGVGLFTSGSAAEWNTVSKINFTRFYAGISVFGLDGHHLNVTAKDINNNVIGILFSASSVGRLSYSNTFTIDNIQGNQNAGIQQNGGCSTNIFNIINLDSNYLHGITGLSSATTNANAVTWGDTFNITNMRNQGSTAGMWGAGLCLTSYSGCTFNITGTVDGNYNALGIGGNPGSSNGIPGAYNNIFNITGTVTATSGFSGGIIVFEKTSGNNLINLTTGTLTSNNQGTLVISRGYQNKIVNGTYSATLVFAFATGDNGELIVVNPTITAASLLSAPNPPYKVSISSYNGDPTNNQIYTGVGNITTDTTTRHTASGVSWKIAMGNSYLQGNAATPQAPLILPLARVAVGASTLVTATVWVYRSHTGHTAKLTCKGGQIAGVNSDVTSTASGAINTWEQLTITFTPTAAGVVDIQLENYTANSTSICYVDDFGIGQV